MKLELSLLALVPLALLCAPGAPAQDASIQTQEKTCLHATPAASSTTQTQFKTESSTVPAVATTDVAITSSPNISKAEIRQLEQAKERVARNKDSAGHRSFMFLRNMMSY